MKNLTNSRKLLPLTLVSMLILTLLISLGACFKGYGAAEYASEYADDVIGARADNMSSKSAEPALAYESDEVLFEDGNGVPDENSAVERKRIYNGSAGLVVDNLDDTRFYIESLATDSGGYVESSFTEYVVLRIPAIQFSEVFELILDAGRLEYSRVETLDVTDAFSDIERLLKTARETRERLYVLLEESSDPKERATILREIGRLTEEVSSLEQQIQLMESRISLSRISVQLIPRSPGNNARENIPFHWIASLDPLAPAGFKLKANVRLNLGEEWAVFSKDSIYMAENGERDHLLISTVSNDPRGDSEFWTRALIHHMSPYYATAVEIEFEIGNRVVNGVELVSKDRTPFRYFVGVIPDGRNLHIVEVFSPDSERVFDSIYQSMSEGELK